MNEYQRRVRKDKIIGYITLFFVILLFVSFSVAVIHTASEIQEIVKKETERRHLPTECRPLYDKGGDEWKECMNVGYK